MSNPVQRGALLLLLSGPLAWSQPSPVPQPRALPVAPPVHDAAPRLPAKALRVPLFRQATGYSCGACSLQAILRYWQVFAGQESQLYAKLDTTPKDGTAPDKLAEVARSFGLTARLQEHTTLEDLRQAVAQGTTVILNLQAWREATTPAKPWKETWEEGHYVVLVGLDERNLYVMDPSVSGAYAYIPVQEFLDRWHDYDERSGVRREYHHLAVFIQGKKPMDRYPGSLVRAE